MIFKEKSMRPIMPKGMLPRSLIMKRAITSHGFAHPRIQPQPPKQLKSLSEIFSESSTLDMSDKITFNPFKNDLPSDDEFDYDELNEGFKK